jgi:hypothetical protein
MLNRLHSKQFKSNKNESVATVIHVITETDDIYLSDLDLDNENFEDKNLNLIGAVVVRKTWEVARNKPNTIIRPHDNYNLNLPIVGETVKLVVKGENRYYERIPGNSLNLGNAQLNIDLVTFPNEDNSNTGNKSSDFREVGATGTPNASTTNQNRTSTFGTYFTENNINDLKPYEGDKITQSRFGQSIRMSAYNNPNNVFSPTIIIRNGQGVVGTKQNSKIEEDINQDGSTILFGSNQYQSNFTATTIQDKIKFENYPTKLDGNQLILNSDRIILSAKTGNMIFHSRGNYGFISDGKFSIDNGLGADLDFGGNVNITTDRTSSNFSVNTGNGKIFLNTDTNGRSPNTSEVEPLVRGNILKQILETLIDLINEQVYKTPAGPTAIGPENKTEFNDLKANLVNMLSTQNFTE